MKIIICTTLLMIMFSGCSSKLHSNGNSQNADRVNLTSKKDKDGTTDKMYLVPNTLHMATKPITPKVESITILGAANRSPSLTVR